MKGVNNYIKKDNSPPRDIPYPNKNKIQPCGEHVKGRDCNYSRRNVNTNKPIKIRFVPKDFNEPGDYLSDNGLMYGSNKKAYGKNTFLILRLE